MDAKKKAATLLDEFKSFAFKGNVVDLAVGVIIGGAFGKLVDGMVKNVLMPVIGVIMPGDQGYLGWKLVVGAKEIPYGLFLGEIVNFIIVAFALFLFIKKFLGILSRNKQEDVVVVASLTKDQELLAEIRDLLRTNSAGKA
jgi:large conductance mechanosensitive channel